MLNRYFSFVIFASLSVVALACGPVHMMTGGNGGEGGGIDGGPVRPCCDDGNPCTDDVCAEDGGCSHAPRDAGAICYGVATDPVHGECTPDATCDITDWTCPHGKPGDKCNSGTGVCAKDLVCCSGGCIDDSGFCAFGPPFGGAPCN